MSDNKLDTTKETLDLQMTEFNVEADILEDPVAPGIGFGCTGKACTSGSWGFSCGWFEKVLNKNNY